MGFNSVFKGLKCSNKNWTEIESNLKHIWQYIDKWLQEDGIWANPWRIRYTSDNRKGMSTFQVRNSQGRDFFNVASFSLA